MRNPWWLVLVCVAFATPSLAAPAWSLLKSGDGRYQILVPGTASVDNEGYDGDTKVHDMSFDLGTGGVYRFKVSDHPAGYGDERPKGERLQDLQDKLIAGTPGARLLNAKTVTQGPWQGRAFSFNTDNGKLIHQARLYLVGDCVYLLDASSPAGAGAKASASVVKFVSSFKILKK